jgi:uncharacterized protein YjiS (DUF1127 family)
MKQVLHMIRQALMRQSTRKQLLTLTADQLNDIGLTPSEALAEARKSLWTDLFKKTLI